jgi:hypothetical protein
MTFRPAPPVNSASFVAMLFPKEIRLYTNEIMVAGSRESRFTVALAGAGVLYHSCYVGSESLSCNVGQTVARANAADRARPDGRSAA